MWCFDSSFPLCTSIDCFSPPLVTSRYHVPGSWQDRSLLPGASFANTRLRIMTAEDFKSLEDKVNSLETTLASVEAARTTQDQKVAELTAVVANQPTADQVSALIAKLESMLTKAAELGKV